MKTKLTDEIIDVPTYYYLPWRIIWTISLVGFGIELILSSKPVFGGLLLFLCIPVLTARYGIRINFRSRTYTDYTSVLGLRSGEEIGFTEIDYVFVKSGTETQRKNSMITSRDFKKDVFDVYLKFDGNEKVFLLTAEKKQDAVEFAHLVSRKLNVELVDYTQDSPVAS